MTQTESRTAAARASLHHLLYLDSCNDKNHLKQQAADARTGTYQAVKTANKQHPLLHFITAFRSVSHVGWGQRGPHKSS